MKSTSTYLAFCLFLGLSLFFNANYSHASPQFNWNGHMLRVDIGAVSNFYDWSNVSGAHASIEPFFELGYEYAFVLDESLFLSAGLSWTVTYPRNFQRAQGFFEPPIALWYTPMTYLQAGYIFPNGVLITGGLVYFWALLGTIRFPLCDTMFFEFKSILWLDRIFDVGGFFGRGFDNLSSSLGVGYRF